MERQVFENWELHNSVLKGTVFVEGYKSTVVEREAIMSEQLQTNGKYHAYANTSKDKEGKEYHHRHIH